MKPQRETVRWFTSLDAAGRTVANGLLRTRMSMHVDSSGSEAGNKFRDLIGSQLGLLAGRALPHQA
jgi:hypothetical protein